MLQVGIIGCGVIGPVHAAAVRLDAAAEVRWACDLDPSKLTRLPARRTTCAAAEVFADCDVTLVCICTQHPTHATLVEAALVAGKHVVCEKPLASTPGDLRRIVAAASAHPGLVASGIFQHRFAPLARRLRQLVAAGAFGEIEALEIDFACTRDEAYYASAPWRGRRIAEGGGVALNQGIHTIDLGLWIAGAEVRRVDGHRSSYRSMPHRTPSPYSPWSSHERIRSSRYHRRRKHGRGPCPPDPIRQGTSP